LIKNEKPDHQYKKQNGGAETLLSNEPPPRCQEKEFTNSGGGVTWEKLGGKSETKGGFTRALPYLRNVAVKQW